MTQSDIGIDASGSGFTGLPTGLATLLRETADRVPQAEAVVDVANGRRLTYRDLWEAATRVAGGLAGSGVRPGDRVAVQLPNGVDWCVAAFGVHLTGAVLVPVNTRLAAAEKAYMVGDCGATVVLDADSPLPHGEPLDRATDDPDSPAAIFYTSGTTGRPKGAVLTHRALLSAVEQCRRALHQAPDEPLRALVAAPLFHILAYAGQLLPAIASGGSVVLLPAFEVRSWLRAIREERIDVLNGVPAMYWQALRHPDFAATDVSGVRTVCYGAAPTPPAQATALLEAFPNARLAPGYGLTECPFVSALDHPDVVAHADSVGTPVAATEVRVEGPEAGAGIGQLLVRGPQLMSGYWGRPEETAAALVDGWLHTGDVVRLDETGRIHILDRRSDMVNRGGENVYTVEVERVLAAHPGVAEVAVVGVPDPMMGHNVGAVVVPRAGEEVTTRSLVDLAAADLADYKVPQFVVFREDPLPRNAAGKVDKAALRRIEDWGPALR